MTAFSAFSAINLDSSFRPMSQEAYVLLVLQRNPNVENFLHPICVVLDLF